MSLIRTPAQKAAAQIFSLNERFKQMAQNHTSQVRKVLTSTMDGKTAIPATQIIAAGEGNLDSLDSVLTSIDGVSALFVPPSATPAVAPKTT